MEFSLVLIDRKIFQAWIQTYLYVFLPSILPPLSFFPYPSSFPMFKKTTSLPCPLRRYKKYLMKAGYKLYQIL